MYELSNEHGVGMEEDYRSIGLTVVWNGKGGAGKSSLAALIAFEANVDCVTNDPLTPLHIALGNGRVKTLAPTEGIPKGISKNTDLVVDLGGFLADRRIADFIKLARHVLVPIIADTPNLNASFVTMKDLRNLTENVVLLPNRLKVADSEALLPVLKSRFSGFPIFPIRESAFFPNLFRDKIGLGELVVKDKLAAHTYRELLKQVGNLMDHLERQH